MGSKGTRSAFAGALCVGLAMVGASVNGLMDVDAELQRSTLAAQQRAPDPLRVSWHARDGHCPSPIVRPHDRI